MDSGVGRSVDWISQLPDSILCHILSFLPTKYAAGTSILSTRWRHLWASVPIIDFDDSLFSKDWCQLSEDAENEVLSSFMNFVNRVLLLSDVSCYRKFSLALEYLDCNFDIVNTWICTAIKRKVQELKLNYSFEFYVSLPRMIFTSETLVLLTLDGGIFLAVPDSVLLPRLKVLNLLSIQYENDDSAQKLFSGCPVIEKLFIDRSIFDNQLVMHVSVPTLKTLMVQHYDYFSEPGDEPDDSESIDEPNVSGSKLIVKCPNLENFNIQDFVSEDFLVEIQNPSFLKAFVDVGRICPKPIRFDSYGVLIWKLLSGIANVVFLTLTSSTISFLSDFNDCGLPTFHNMIHLDFGADGDPGWNLLTDFLKCSPNLEVLILSKGRWLPDSDQHWTRPRRVPRCVLLHLKDIEIQEFNGVEYELEAIEYLLKNAKVLKKMTIDCRHLDTKEKFSICEKLAQFPRDSRACQLNLLS